jgi:hypothetical protein
MQLRDILDVGHIVILALCSKSPAWYQASLLLAQPSRFEPLDRVPQAIFQENQGLPA